MITAAIIFGVYYFLASVLGAYMIGREGGYDMPNFARMVMLFPLQIPFYLIWLLASFCTIVVSFPWDMAGFMGKTVYLNRENEKNDKIDKRD